MMAIVSRMTNINFNRDDPSWLQATLPVGSGSHGFRSASSLAPSAFLASADGASDLMYQLLPPQLSSVPYHDKDCALSIWKSALPVDAAVPTTMNWQKSWDQPMVQHQLDTLLAGCPDQVSLPRLLGASSKESRAWLYAPPISSLGLCMSDDAVRTTIVTLT